MSPWMNTFASKALIYKPTVKLRAAPVRLDFSFLVRQVCPPLSSRAKRMSLILASDIEAINPLRDAFRARLAYETVAKNGSADERRDSAFRALAFVCREQLSARWGKTQAEDAVRVHSGQSRRVHYLSMEFLLGRALSNAIAALGCAEELRVLLKSWGLSLPEVLEGESDAALGNGGLGRLAACFLDAFAELSLPSFGYGLRYQYGMFAQAIQQGRQVELPDDWMRLGNPWEVARPELRYIVGFGGTLVSEGAGRRWLPAQSVYATAYDFIVPAHHSERVSTLRQWQASAVAPIDFHAFCRGDYQAAGAHRLQADALNWVLYPDDSTPAGRELRLKQEYLLVSASMQDLICRHEREGGAISELGLRNAIHLNDTHPALAPAELMRLLIDEHGQHWDNAWRITSAACSYTNHTLMPEALETWPVEMFERLLPRHLELIYQINERFLADVRTRFAGDEALVSRVSMIDENHGRRVRMAHLAIHASHKVNGVAALHSTLMTQTIFADFAKLYPGRFHNVTNGVTPRRWLQQANPELSNLIDGAIGSDWRRDLMALKKLSTQAQNPALGAQFLQVKLLAKQRLATRIRQSVGVAVNPSSLFDVQIKRIHEYKRQLLNVLHVIARYQAILQNPNGSEAATPRVVIIAGKAASAYVAAKQIIQLTNDVARLINSDPRIGDKLKLVFLPNYGISLAEAIIPAADLSEQISTAGTEASGTGNMKLALNGACTIGTWDGANIEMAQAIGSEHFFEFGLRADAVAAVQNGDYQPRHEVQQNPQLAGVLRAIASGEFSPEEPARYRSLIDSLLNKDRYLLLADFTDYLRAQAQVDACYQAPAQWAERALHNIAGMGQFSVDRSVQEYMDRVWTRSPD
jgi:glycogen phosphorylase